jgi:hypothetical protein
MTGQIQQTVILSGGSRNGQAASAPMPPDTLLVTIDVNGEPWVETYYYDGQTKEGMPVMQNDGHVEPPATGPAQDRSSPK